MHSQTHNSGRALKASQMNILAILITGPKDSAIPEMLPIIPGRLVPPSKSLAPPRAYVLLYPPWHSHSRHTEHLRQRATRDQRHDHQHEHLQRVPSHVVVDIFKKPADLRNETAAWPRTARLVAPRAAG